MPLEVEWYMPYRVIDARFSGVITLADIEEQSRLFAQFLTEAQDHAPGKMVYLLFDTLEAQNMPPIYTMMKQGMPILRFTNRGPAFHITRSKSIRSIVELAAHITRFQLYSFTDREEAIHAMHDVMLRDETRSTAR